MYAYIMYILTHYTVSKQVTSHCCCHLGSTKLAKSDKVQYHIFFPMVQLLFFFVNMATNEGQISITYPIWQKQHREKKSAVGLSLKEFQYQFWLFCKISTYVLPKYFYFTKGNPSKIKIIYIMKWFLLNGVNWRTSKPCLNSKMCVHFIVLLCHDIIKDKKVLFAR